jgi:hypothetical protein
MLRRRRGKPGDDEGVAPKPSLLRLLRDLLRGRPVLGAVLGGVTAIVAFLLAAQLVGDVLGGPKSEFEVAPAPNARPQ